MKSTIEPDNYPIISNEDSEPEAEKFEKSETDSEMARQRLKSTDSINSNPKSWADFEEENRSWRVSTTFIYQSELFWSKFAFILVNFLIDLSLMLRLRWSFFNHIWSTSDRNRSSHGGTRSFSNSSAFLDRFWCKFFHLKLVFRKSKSMTQFEGFWYFWKV